MCSRNHVVLPSSRSKTTITAGNAIQRIVRISKEQCCGRLGTSSCIVCSISYSRSGANGAGGVEVVMAIVVERWECSVRRSFVRVVVSWELRTDALRRCIAWRTSVSLAFDDRTLKAFHLERVKGITALHGTPSQSTGCHLPQWDHTVLHCTQHKRTPP